MTIDLDDVQRIVLRGGDWWAAQHLALDFSRCRSPLHFLQALKHGHHWPTPTSDKEPTLQVSFGFSRRGLERAQVRWPVLTCFAAKAPGYTAGAALRAANHLAMTGRDGPQAWAPAFDFAALDAVISMHAMEVAALHKAVRAIEELARLHAVRAEPLPEARRLEAPPNEQWVHFGYRDALARIGIKRWTPPEELAGFKPISQHAAGEFVLGHAQDSGANPWVSGPGRQVWPDELRRFFHNGSFGVLQQIEQHVFAFEDYVGEQAKRLQRSPLWLKAKLCGRTTTGWRMAADPAEAPEADFDYADDDKGQHCPFGSHVRRMNPRTDTGVHGRRTRALVRRGMPYGPSIEADPCRGNTARGLLGHFFCASIEDQFEHLLAQWAERVPMGSDDGGGARDPLIGAHEDGDGGFEIPMPGGQPIMLPGLRPFTRTHGIAYLFYPSLTTLCGIAKNELFADLDEDDA